MSEARKVLARKESPVLSREGAVSTGSTLLNLACSDRPDIGFQKGGYYYIVGDTASGKAQPVRSKVMTPDGWKVIGSLQIGDTITDPDGGVANVTGVFPKGRLPVFCVVLSDGTKTECCGDHLWLVENINDRARNTERIKTTKEIEDVIAAGTWERFYVPVARPTIFRKQNSDLPLHPYLLGCLLGNGHFGRSILFSSTESEILEKLKLLLPANVSFHHISKGDYLLCKAGGYTNPLKSAIKALHLDGTKAHTKFIPYPYLRASIQNRILLLQGMLDTDGYVCPLGSLSFSSVSKRMAEQLAELVRSLGGIATISQKIAPKYTYRGEVRTGRTCYNVSIRMQDRESLVTLKRKRERIKSKGLANRYVVSVTPIGKKECVCISTSAKRHLYITDDYVVTHNTWTSMTCFAEACRNPAFKNYRLIFDDVEGGALMDIERYFGKEVAKRLESPSTKNGKPVHSDTVESFYYHLTDLIEEGEPFIYVLDSQDALSSESSEKKFAKQRKASDEDQDAKGSFGDGKAKYHSEHIRMVLSGIQKLGSILIIIGQTRDNLGMGFEKKTRSGGRALPFYANLEIWTSVAHLITRNVMGKDRTVGAMCQAYVKKNRVSGKTGKDRTVQIPIYYSHGIDDVGACVEYLIEEGHWKKKDHPDDKRRKIFDAHDFDFEGSVSELIRFIEEENLESKLVALVGKVWQEIEEATAVVRKPRYA